MVNVFHTSVDSKVSSVRSNYVRSVPASQDHRVYVFQRLVPRPFSTGGIRMVAEWNVIGRAVLKMSINLLY